MKRIDGSETGIFDIAWSPDSQWLTYLRGEDEICMAQVDSGDIRVIGPGGSPGLTADLSVVIERDDEIVLVSGGGEKTLVGKSALLKGSPKRAPLVSPDGSKLLFVVCNVFDKKSEAQNAYAYRHFIGISGADGSKPLLTGEQWYGGSSCWFPDSNKLTHYEFDSTGGARVHVVNDKGEPEGTVFGLFPSVSPDGQRIACKPRGGGTIVLYTNHGGSWARDAVEATVLKLPESQGRISATPPQWLDNRLVLVDEGGKLWRVDTRKDNADEMTKLPLPTTRGRHAMAISPSRELLALEVEAAAGFELCVAPLP
ncbi:MAG: PD40 domain-containing protein [Deltaproteobacteria bacterium]|nr:PD40 domain-containing protein [Deltaproteobacteria bacterium]